MPHSNALHSRLRERGAYLCGPLARFALNSDRLSPLGARGGTRGRARPVVPQPVPQHRRARGRDAVRVRRGAAHHRGLRAAAAPFVRRRARAPRPATAHRGAARVALPPLPARRDGDDPRRQDRPADLAEPADHRGRPRALRAAAARDSPHDELTAPMRAGDPQLRSVHLVRDALPDGCRSRRRDAGPRHRASARAPPATTASASRCSTQLRRDGVRRRTSSCVRADEDGALVPLLETPRAVVIVDAVLGSPPGRVVELAPADLVARRRPRRSRRHGLGVPRRSSSRARSRRTAVTPSIRVVGVTIERPARYAQASRRRSPPRCRRGRARARAGRRRRCTSPRSRAGSSTVVLAAPPKPGARTCVGARLDRRDRDALGTRASRSTSPPTRAARRPKGRASSSGWCTSRRAAGPAGDTTRPTTTCSSARPAAAPTASCSADRRRPRRARGRVA